jgi:hypothetical protein
MSFLFSVHNNGKGGSVFKVQSRLIVIFKTKTMARKKLAKIPELVKAETRASALESIDANLDLNNGLTLPDYTAQIGNLQKKVSKYNTVLSQVDDLYNEVIAQIDVVNDWSERMLTGIASKFGKNSSQYEMAGGVKKDERKKPKVKKA